MVVNEMLGPKANICSGEVPKTGKHKGEGGYCATFGWTRPWCYVSKDLVHSGRQFPGKEFVRKSKIYTHPQRWYAPCTPGDNAKQKQTRAYRRKQFLDESMFRMLQKLLAKGMSAWNHGRVIILQQHAKNKDLTKGALTCEMRFSFFVVSCSTCCCKNGLIQTEVNTELTKSGPNCATWFSLMDLIGRSYLGVMRVMNSIEMVKGCT